MTWAFSVVSLQRVDMVYISQLISISDDDSDDDNNDYIYTKKNLWKEGRLR